MAIILICLKGRENGQLKVRAKEFRQQNEMTDHVLSTVFNYPVIADYDRRTLELDKFESCKATCLPLL